MTQDAPAEYGVIGHPVAHSRSPFIHGFFAKETGQHMVYRMHDVSPERKTADNLLQIVTSDMQMCKDRYGMDFIGYCSDDGGDSRGMRKRLGRVDPRLLIFPCLSHQVSSSPSCRQASS